MCDKTVYSSTPISSIPGMTVVWQRLEPVAYILMRCLTGAILATHGAARFRLIDIGGPTIESTAKFNAMFGFEPGLLWSYYETSLELIGGILLILGLLTRPTAILLALLLFVATVYVTPHFGFWSRENGFEYSLALLLLVFYILARGGGPLSLDRQIGLKV